MAKKKDENVFTEEEKALIGKLPTYQPPVRPVKDNPRALEKEPNPNTTQEGN